MLVVIGDVLIDHDIVLKTTRSSPEGHWPICEVEKQESRPGGAGAVCEMVKGLGGHAVLFGSKKDNSLKTRYFLDGKQVFRVDKDNCKPLDPLHEDRLLELVPRHFSNLDYVLVADYGKGVITDKLWRGLLGTGLKIIVDPARNKPLDWYRGAYALCPNRAEAGGCKTLSEAIAVSRRIRQHYPRLCLKLDHDGMIAAGDGQSAHIAAKEFPATFPLDVCGAGDMVLAALGVALTHGRDWLSACTFANDMAGRKCLQHGATPVVAQPDRS